MGTAIGFGRFFSVLACGVLLLANTAHSDEDAADTPRAVIKFADHGGINDWRATDRKTLYVEGRHGDWFKATVFGTCPGLRFTDTIGFETESNGDLDVFSAVLVNGRRCAFRTFEAVDGPPKKNSDKPDSDAQESDEQHSSKE